MNRTRAKRSTDESLILAVYHERPRCFDFATANEGKNDGERVRRNRIRSPADTTSLVINYDFDQQLLTGKFNS